MCGLTETVTLVPVSPVRRNAINPRGPGGSSPLAHSKKALKNGRESPTLTGARTRPSVRSRGPRSEQENQHSAIRAVLAAANLARQGLDFALRKHHCRVELTAALIVPLPTRIPPLVKKPGRGQTLRAVIIHVGGKQLGPSLPTRHPIDAQAARRTLKRCHPCPRLRPGDAIHGARIVTKGGQHLLNGADTPALR
jgi:hypothetical protein